MKRVLWILALSAACGLSMRAMADETPAEASPPAGEHVQMDGCAGCDGQHWVPQCCGQPRCPWGDLWAGYCHERRPCPCFDRPRHCCEPAADYCCEPCGGSWEGCGGCGWDFFGLFRNCGSCCEPCCCEPECCEEACCEPECCEEHCCAEPCCNECDPCCGGCGWDLFGFFNKCFDHGCCDSCCEESCCEPECCVEAECCEPECCEEPCCDECDPCCGGCGWDLFGYFHKCCDGGCGDSCCEDSCCETECCEPECCDECDSCGHGCGWDLFGFFGKCFGGGHSDCCQDMVVVSDEAVPCPAASESPTPAKEPEQPMPEAEGAPTAELPTGRPLYLPRGTEALELAPSA